MVCRYRAHLVKYFQQFSPSRRICNSSSIPTSVKWCVFCRHFKFNFVSLEWQNDMVASPFSLLSFTLSLIPAAIFDQMKIFTLFQTSAALSRAISLSPSVYQRQQRRIVLSNGLLMRFTEEMDIIAKWMRQMMAHYLVYFNKRNPTNGRTIERMDERTNERNNERTNATGRMNETNTNCSNAAQTLSIRISNRTYCKHKIFPNN